MTVAEQRKAALAVANERRMAIAAARERVSNCRSLHTALLMLADEIGHRHEAIPGVLIWDAAGWMFKCREETKFALIGASGCGLMSTVGSLSDRQRLAFCEAARAMALARQNVGRRRTS